MLAEVGQPTKRHGSPGVAGVTRAEGDRLVRAAPRRPRRVAPGAGEAAVRCCPACDRRGPATAPSPKPVSSPSPELAVNPARHRRARWEPTHHPVAGGPFPAGQVRRLPRRLRLDELANERRVGMVREHMSRLW